MKPLNQFLLTLIFALILILWTLPACHKPSCEECNNCGNSPTENMEEYKVRLRLGLNMPNGHSVFSPIYGKYHYSDFAILPLDSSIIGLTIRDYPSLEIDYYTPEQFRTSDTIVNTYRLFFPKQDTIPKHIDTLVTRIVLGTPNTEECGIAIRKILYSDARYNDSLYTKNYSSPLLYGISIVK